MKVPSFFYTFKKTDMQNTNHLIEIKKTEGGYTAKIEGSGKILVDLLVVTMIKDKNFHLLLEEALSLYKHHQTMMN